jgi:hypothetical protein
MSRPLSGLTMYRCLRQPEVLVDTRAVQLERALLADDRLLEVAVRLELGVIDWAPRGGAALVETLEAWLANGQNVRATARALSIAARTVSYRLERIERLLGRPLEGVLIARLATALFARRLTFGSREDVVSG